MKRARATALALVNWKGVFYERYLLDRHVTALEGANGAGKTTVMIAAFVVLMPDMSRLRFSNVGESGGASGDKGVWGRLGEPERPSYAALELVLSSGARAIMGVHLERKSEPSLEITPFFISDLTREQRLQDLLLITDGEYDHVPLLKEFRANVAHHGATLEVFATTKEYFSRLFEYGITPLRLASDEDRNKLNEMLRTSMTGGISRALTSELRSFLLKEESGLSETLSRMRDNLDACRRTRIEVAEARRLEHEINGVYEAGQSMFAAAVEACRLMHDESCVAVDALAEEHDRAVGQARELETSTAQLRARRDACSERLSQLESTLANEKQRVERIERARVAAAEQAKVRGELEELLRASEAARLARERASEERQRAQQSLERARGDYDDAARGIADVQRGLDEMYRRAHTHRAACALFEELRRVSAEPELTIDGLAALRARVDARIAELDTKSAELERRAKFSLERAREYECARAALAQIAGAVEGQEFERARTELARLSQLEARIEQNPELERDLEHAQRLAERQALTRHRARAAGIEPGAGAVAALERALHEAESEARREEQSARTDQAGSEHPARVASALAAKLRELDARIGRWDRVRTELGRLAATFGKPCTNRAELAALRQELGREHEQVRAVVDDAHRRREQLLREISALETNAASFHPELVRLCDELGGELLAERFEDTEPDEAARLEARLGPLLQALVVADPRAAARAVAGKERELPTVWFIADGAEIELGAAADDASHSNDCVVTESAGVRVTRVSTRPTLGRAARQRRVLGLRDELTGVEAELERALGRTHELSAAIAESDRLLHLGELIDERDPRSEQATTQSELERELIRERELREHSAAAHARSAAAYERAETLRALLPDAYLLEATDQSALARELDARRASLVEARRELARVAQPRRELASLIDVLREPPLDTDAAELARSERVALDEERDRWFKVARTAEQLARVEHALGWADAEQAVSGAGDVLPELKAQLATLAEAVTLAQNTLKNAESAWETRTLTHQEAHALSAAANAQLERLERERAELVPDHSELALAAARDAGLRTEAEILALRGEQRALEAQVAVHEERTTQKESAARQLAERLRAERARAEPAQFAWETLRRAAETHGVLATAWLHHGRDLPGRTSVSAWAEAASRCELLCDRLSAARASELAAQIRRDGEATAQGLFHLNAWLTARDWLKRRLPAQVAEVAEPLEALDRLRSHLAALEQRLGRQETDLRVASEDVARSIDVQIRRAATQVRRLNQHLSGVSFGSIRGIRVQMRRNERMAQILTAFREGSAQELLFHPTLPIEDALNEIFRRYGGGKSGGQRLLDYREYLELGIEIQRRSDASWEVANPSRLSTGEAIGVGAALMMVVLTEWERDAKLLRPKQAGGSLRFLFLDEANRLSQDNLGVLFELCQNLDLQLLIAAPEVARAHGNTTYRLVRVLTEDGREEVLVSGRRTVQSEPEPGSAPHLEENNAEELST